MLNMHIYTPRNQQKTYTWRHIVKMLKQLHLDKHIFPQIMQVTSSWCTNKPDEQTGRPGMMAGDV